MSPILGVPGSHSAPEVWARARSWGRRTPRWRPRAQRRCAGPGGADRLARAYSVLAAWPRWWLAPRLFQYSVYSSARWPFYGRAGTGTAVVNRSGRNTSPEVGGQRPERPVSVRRCSPPRRAWTTTRWASSRWCAATACTATRRPRRIPSGCPRRAVRGTRYGAPVVLKVLLERFSSVLRALSAFQSCLQCLLVVSVVF